MPTIMRIIGPVAAVLTVFITGFLMSRSGKPYNDILLNVHKLVGLAMVIFFIIMLIRTGRMGLLKGGALAAGIIALLIFAGLLVTGGLLTLDKPVSLIVIRMHHILPYLAVVSVTATFYFLRQVSH